MNRRALAVGILAAITFAFPTAASARPAVAPKVSGASATRAIPMCPWKHVRFSASMKATSFELGQPIVLVSKVTNRDSIECAITIGHDHGYDPSQVVVTHRKPFVWDACDLDNKAGACSRLWQLKDLDPGASYTLTSKWDQRWGPGAGKHGQVPAGSYRFGSSYTDLINSVLYQASASVSFAIR